MRLTAWVLAAGMALAPGLALVEAGCVAARAAGSPRLAGPAPPAPDGADDPADPCADPDALDGLDDPCYVDVPPEEVARVMAAARRARADAQNGTARE
ncbi:MAG: hypothetical protein HY906_16445 [Deltaproteobacteria bacterium]|nr:hypothetical protein [Deltaproteobacteria bacterium]